jgi:pseudolysin/vibriolysin
MEDAAANDAHGHAEITLAMLRDWYGLDSVDDAGKPIISLVHVGDGWDNASWNGTYVSYGDGSDAFYPLSGSLDVAAHEIHHAYTEFHSNLEYDGESGGLDESFSDIGGTVAEFYLGQPPLDLEIAEDVVKDRPPIRSMCTPADNGHAIADYADFEPELNVHDSSGIGNRAFCVAASFLHGGGSDTELPAAIRRAAEPWYAANAR